MFGKPEVLAEIVGSHEKAPFKWKNGSVWRDPGDLPSTRHQRKLLTWARKHAVPLTAEHLVFGASEAEVAALLAQAGPENGPALAVMAPRVAAE